MFLYVENTQFSGFVSQIKMCHVDQCCCGCTNQKTGVLIWAIVDIVLNIIAVIFYSATIGTNTIAIWLIIIIIADFLLIFGGWKLNTGLMLLWQIINMIQIVLLFVCWLVIPIMVKKPIEVFENKQ